MGQSYRGPMSENLEFKTVSAPEDYRAWTKSPVRYLPVSRSGILMGYLWASVDEDGADFIPRESQWAAAKNMAIAWVERTRWAYAAGLTPSQFLRYWVGKPEDPKCGQVVSAPEQTAESLYALNRLALDIDHAGMVRGSLLGGALGDALGNSVEFSSLAAIRDRFGRDGIVVLDESSGQISDDTQMTLFVAEGLIGAVTQHADLATTVYQASLRWLATQSLPGPPELARGLAAQEWLYARRAPGNACLSGLEARNMGTPGAPANPNSKGCGAVMRSAPFGLIPAHDVRTAFANAAACATQTHGHPSGFLSAGALAGLIRLLYGGTRIADALPQVLELLAEHDGHEEVSAALNQAIRAAESGPAPSAEVVETLGQGWVAEEALAIGVYCALVYEPNRRGEPTWALRDAIRLAVNHSGDSDSTGSICGNIMGVIFGQYALPRKFFLDELEGRDQIIALADEFAAATAPGR